jgi:hypothetical protein
VYLRTIGFVSSSHREFLIFSIADDESPYVPKDVAPAVIFSSAVKRRYFPSPSEDADGVVSSAPQGAFEPGLHIGASGLFLTRLTCPFEIHFRNHEIRVECTIRARTVVYRRFCLSQGSCNTFPFVLGLAPHPAVRDQRHHVCVRFPHIHLLVNRMAGYVSCSKERTDRLWRFLPPPWLLKNEYLLPQIHECSLSQPPQEYALIHSLLLAHKQNSYPSISNALRLLLQHLWINAPEHGCILPSGKPFSQY